MSAPVSTGACPSCAAPLPRRNRGDARTSRRAAVLYVVGALVGGAWAVGVALWSPVFLVPDGPGGIVGCGIFYLWPGLLIGFWASRLPKVRTLSCTGCGWSEVREIRAVPRRDRGAA